MDEHFRAFSFVDRITAVQPGERISGRYTIPPGIDDFPGSLVAESVGQLAAWAALAAHDFRRRPVAGLAAGVELLAPVQPGQTLELAAELSCADEDAVAYSGTAQVGATTVIRLNDCVGPMVPAEEFDDPQALRERFALLCGAGAVAGAFPGLPSLGYERTGGERGQRACALVHVPTGAPFFADHFPRRPVFPGSLLMHVNLHLAAGLVGELPPPAAGLRWRLEQIMDMKLRAFTPPGEVLNIEAKVARIAPDYATLALETRNARELVATARLRFIPETQP